MQSASPRRQAATGSVTDQLELQAARVGTLLTETERVLGWARAVLDGERPLEQDIVSGLLAVAGRYPEICEALRRAGGGGYAFELALAEGVAQGIPIGIGIEKERAAARPAKHRHRAGPPRPLRIVGVALAAGTAAAKLRAHPAVARAASMAFSRAIGAARHHAFAGTLAAAAAVTGGAVAITGTMTLTPYAVQQPPVNRIEIAPAAAGVPSSPHWQPWTLTAPHRVRRILVPVSSPRHVTGRPADAPSAAPSLLPSLSTGALAVTPAILDLGSQRTAQLTVTGPAGAVWTATATSGIILSAWSGTITPGQPDTIAVTVTSTAGSGGIVTITTAAGSVAVSVTWARQQAAGA